MFTKYSFGTKIQKPKAKNKKIKRNKRNLQMYDLQTKPTPEKLSKILSYIDANNYDLWVMVSLVLGREYPNNQEVLNILHQWGATASNRKHKDDQKEEKNFLAASSGNANSG